ncbi:MAG TPA: M48 family metallopeptidase [Methylomirabilota bacterium]|nr:M48 family metallopeptidase [Methylomirabilota bacterium]
MRIPRLSAVALAACLTAACAGATSAPQPAPSPRPQSSTTSRPLDQAQAQRLQRVMVPLIRAMDNKRSLDQVRVGIVDNGQINAANAGGGEFYVTTGLLQKANEEQLQAILAHEVAHDDLGHVAKAQVLGTGLNIGVMILDQLFPGSAAITPIAGQLIARGYSRNEEYAADRHGVELLRRIGKPKEQMIETLTWLQETAGASGEGGFFATHPATGDRIEALRQIN